MIEVSLSVKEKVKKSGNLPIATSNETGGLKNLRLSVENAGGRMSVLSPDYTIIIHLPR